MKLETCTGSGSLLVTTCQIKFNYRTNFLLRVRVGHIATYVYNGKMSTSLFSTVPWIKCCITFICIYNEVRFTFMFIPSCCSLASYYGKLKEGLKRFLNATIVNSGNSSFFLSFLLLLLLQTGFISFACSSAAKSFKLVPKFCTLTQAHTRLRTYYSH